MKNPYNILIIEDELLIAEMLKSMLEKFGENVVGIARSYGEVETFLQERPEIDFAVIDINLEKEKNGIDIAQELIVKNQIPLIYITSYADEDNINNAAKTKPEGYIIKPFSPKDILATFTMIRARKSNKSKGVVVRDGKRRKKIPSDDIYFIKSDNNYLDIITSSEKHVVRSSLENIMEVIDDTDFIKTHRSYVVNLSKIDEIEGQFVRIKDEKIPISRKHQQQVFEKYYHS